jgi:Family of unknown function (DUF5856)
MAANEMIAKLFHARTAAHMAHLQTRSFAEHKALDDFYNEIVELADTFAETYQGFYGLIKDYPAMGLPSGEACEWITGLRLWLEKNREGNCKGQTPLQNINDEIMALCAQTCYKLRFLNGGGVDSDDDKEYLGMSKW